MSQMRCVTIPKPVAKQNAFRKVEKREISLFAPYQRGRFCAEQFRDIYFVHNIQILAENFNMVTYSLLVVAYNSLYDTCSFYHCT